MYKKTYIFFLIGLITGLISCNHGDPPHKQANPAIPVNLIKVENQHLIYYDINP